MAKTKNTSSGFIGRWFKRLFITAALLALIGLIIGGVFVSIARSELQSFEELKQSPNGQMIRVRAADGTIIQTFGPSFGRWLSIDDIPDNMKDAMVAVEDRRFQYHYGVDPIGIARSFYTRIQKGRFTQGGSTITQQLARNLFLNNRREFGRKLREMILATAMETKFSKDQILELYLNKVYFGGGAYGVDAASRTFFDHSATELSLAESAIVAGLVKAPSNYSPTADAQAAIDRASVVVEVMQDAGMITAAQANDVKPAEVKLAADKPQNSVRYFTDYALPQLDSLIDETEKPLDVWTTIDLRMQRAATAAIQANVPRGVQGALVSMDNDGAVLAMVGGSDYVASNYNRAVTAVRQPGSSWKLFVYLAALEAGLRPDDQVVDEPVEINGWVPRNSGDSYAGQISLKTAFTFSKNTIAAQIGNEFGTSTIAGMARRMGISTPINTSPSMVLGTSEARVIEMTRAYAIVGNDGRDVEPYFITKVTTIDNDILYQHRPSSPKQILEDWVAAGMTELLANAVQSGTGRAAQIGRPIGGKTGTTSSNKDGWFLGFSSGITTGVWMGRDDARPVGGLEGGRAPARAFSAFMRTAVSGRPITEFTLVEFPEREGDEDSVLGVDEENLFIDENGMPLEGLPELESDGGLNGTAPELLDEGWIDRVLGRQESRPSPARPNAQENRGAGQNSQNVPQAPQKPTQPRNPPAKPEPARPEPTLDDLLQDI